MSEKIKQALSDLEARALDIAGSSNDPEQLILRTIFDDRCSELRKAILAEFAKLNAVREKLAEALYKVLPAAEARYEEYGDIGGSDNFAQAIEALAANAELEGK